MMDDVAQETTGEFRKRTGIDLVEATVEPDRVEQLDQLICKYRNISAEDSKDVDPVVN